MIFLIMKMLRYAFAYTCIALLVAVSTSSSASATLTPPPRADFSPVFNNRSSANFVNIPFNIRANGHPGLVGKTLHVIPVICNGISISDWNDCEVDARSATTTYLYDPYSSTVVTFGNLSLFYIGKNYVTCYVYEPISGIGDFCGAEHYSYSSYFDYKEIDYTGGLLPVYRFWSDTKKHHFFTINNNEKRTIINTYDRRTWNYEKPAFFAYRSEVCYGSPVFRFWSDTKQGHFYTIHEYERDSIIRNYPTHVWRYEGIAYCAYQQSVLDLDPIYRFWSDTQQGHFYTADPQERDSIIRDYPSNVWKYEGVAFYTYQ